MDKNLRFSIVVPIYNVEKFLDQCITSVLSQSYDNYELILVDDGATDNSGKICDAYALYRAAKKEELTAARPFLSMVGTNFCRIPSYSILLSYSAPLT